MRDAARSSAVAGARRYAPSSRLPVAGIYVLMAAVCARTRVPIAILSGVVHITPAKVCIFSLVCAIVFLTEKKGTDASLLDDRPGEPRFQV